MWRLGTWFSGGIDSVRLMFGLDDFEGLLKPMLFYDFMILSLFACIIECDPWKRRKTKYLQEHIQIFLLQCPFSYKERPLVFHVIHVNSGVLPSPFHIPAHVSGEKRFLKKILGWWEETHTFYLFQISSPLTLMILIHRFHPSAFLRQEIGKVNRPLKLFV